MATKKMTDEVFEQICIELETTYKGINTLCKESNSSGRAFYNYKDGETTKQRLSNLEEYNARHQRYARAREKQLDFLEEQLREVAYDNRKDGQIVGNVNVGTNHIQRDRLKVDTLKFVLGKLRARKWGDKIDVTTDGEKIEAINVTIVRPGESEK
jgi:hypothetical protein